MITVDPNILEIDKRELFARLSGNIDDLLLAKAEKRLKSVCECAFIYKKCEIIKTEDGLDLGFGVIPSKNLAKNLEGCTKAFVMAVTLGHGCERELKRTALISPLDQFVTDAVASSVCEALTDKAQELLPEKTGVRFSVGYGDFDLAFQKPLLEFLDAKKQLGITLSDAYLMTPTKSVTAIAGIK